MRRRSDALQFDRCTARAATSLSPELPNKCCCIACCTSASLVGVILLCHDHVLPTTAIANLVTSAVTGITCAAMASPTARRPPSRKQSHTRPSRPSYRSRRVSNAALPTRRSSSALSPAIDQHADSQQTLFPFPRQNLPRRPLPLPRNNSKLRRGLSVS
jgi:hypothetical protein